MAKNPNCDGEHCDRQTGDVRVLPAGGSGNLILCFQCYLSEMRFRVQRNAELAECARFGLPAWDSLHRYVA